MTRGEIVRTAIWAAPAVLTFLLVAVRRPSRRLMAGIGLALAWNLWSVLALNIVALRLGWWSFDPTLPGFMGVPFEPWLGWVLLWGAVAPLAGFDRPIAVVTIAFLWADLLVMPLLKPQVMLGDAWLVGDLVGVAAALVPGVLLARWTVARTNLNARATLQVVCTGALMLWLVPSIALRGSWAEALDVAAWQASVGIQILIVPIALGIRAVNEFVHVGGGTPIPYDPPMNLVRTGPYAYVRNPMQLAMVVLLALGAIPFGTAWMVAGAAIAVAYSAGLAEWHENLEMAERFGAQWDEYRGRVRAWVPRWRPALQDEATLRVAFSCGVCSSVGRWFSTRSPVGLAIAPAEDAPGPTLRRVTYVPAAGPPSQGVAAIAKALEHIHLGWAVVGWILALPGIVHLAQ
ncbi:MAG: isoprenylcysteine carboxylmethyltransferase family protein, partial [Actinobacteria bacterium]|nr:isoprenylcysteine carboxylmethyltransferase family protein [Actinomycetota bacterium]